MSRQLAWDLADQLCRHLSTDERMAVFVDLGGGDDEAAIHRLIAIAVKRGHPLPTRMAEHLQEWAHAHRVRERNARTVAEDESAPATE